MWGARCYTGANKKKKKKERKKNGRLKNDVPGHDEFRNHFSKCLPLPRGGRWVGWSEVGGWKGSTPTNAGGATGGGGVGGQPP